MDLVENSVRVVGDGLVRQLGLLEVVFIGGAAVMAIGGS